MPINLLAAQTAASPLLDPPTRAVLLMSLLAFVLLGMALMVGAMLGGRWARRWGGDDLRTPLPLRRGRHPQQERTPAMLRGVHFDSPATQDTARLSPGASETATR